MCVFGGRGGVGLGGEGVGPYLAGAEGALDDHDGVQHAALLALADEEAAPRVQAGPERHQREPARGGGGG